VGSNTTLRNHIEHPHCEAKKAQKNQNSEAGQTSMARDGSVFMYDPDYLREQFAGLVIQRALPFNHFDHEQTTRVFQNTMQPRYTHFFDDTFASKSKSYFKESLKGLYNLYYAKYGNPTQSSQTNGGATSSKASGGNMTVEKEKNGRGRERKERISYNLVCVLELDKMEKKCKESVYDPCS
ncbi:hypothetical protein Tco_1111400, partial [Tanacetum coccineum]